MKLAEISISLPLYHIQSRVNYCTKRKPTVFERMILRLCDPTRSLPDKQKLSLFDIFHNQLGAGDVSELLESCVSDLVTLGALPKPYNPNMLELPIANLTLTENGMQFLRDNSLPARQRKDKVYHFYDPVSAEIKQAKNNSKNADQNSVSYNSDAVDKYLKPQNLQSQIELAVEQGTYNWKNPSTSIDNITIEQTSIAKWEDYKVEVSCSKDGRLSISAPYDQALQRWLDQAQSEAVWEILLSGHLKHDLNAPILDSSVLENARAIRLIATNSIASKARLCIVTQGIKTTDIDINTPTIILSHEVQRPEFVTNNQNKQTLLMPPPTEMIKGFRSLSLLQTNEENIQAEVTGNFHLYWAGQRHQCGLTVTLDNQTTTEIWNKLRTDLENICKHSDDLRITFLPVAWQDIDTIVWPWLAMRAKQPLTDLIALVTPTIQAIRLWRHDEKDWKSEWEESLAKAIDKSLEYTPNQLDLTEITSLSTLIANILSEDKAYTQQAALLHHAAPLHTLEELKKLRRALLSRTEIPKELLSIELQQIWLEHILTRKDLNLYDPHALQQPIQDIQKAVQDVYRHIGESTLEAASQKQIDVRTLTHQALDAVNTWRKTAEIFRSLNISSPLWDALDKKVEEWNRLAEEI